MSYRTPIFVLAQKIKVFDMDMGKAALNYKIKRIRVHPKWYFELCCDPLSIGTLTDQELNGEITFMGINIEIDSKVPIKEKVRFEITPRIK